MKNNTFLKKIALIVILFLSINTINAAGTYPAGGTGTALDPYLISTSTDLLTLCNPVNKDDWNKSFKLTTDIDMTGVTTFTSIGVSGGSINKAFNGGFDGNNKIISNLTVAIHSDQTMAIGFFGWVQGSKIKNLGFKNLTVDHPTLERIGGIVGHYQWGTTASIDNCFINGGTIRGTGRIGGICGWLLEGEVSNCITNVSVIGAWGTQAAIVGQLHLNSSKITNCVNYKIQSTCKPICTITSGVTPTITNAYFVEDVLNVAPVGTGTSIAPAVLSTQTSYAGFDFSNTWSMNPIALLKSFPETAFWGISVGGITTYVDNSKAIDKYAYSANDSKLNFDTEIVKATVYSLNGSLVMKSNVKSNSISLADLSKGIYLIKATTVSGDNITLKINK